MRINPSNTGNIRMQSLWHLGDNLRLTFDPSWQYVLANGGGTSTINETPAGADMRPLGNANVTGFDLNGDGDILDTVRFYSPNNTNTKRWGATTSLIWDINEDNRLRFAYTYDHASHRQTAQWGNILGDGPVENVFGGRKGQPRYCRGRRHHPRPRPLSRSPNSTSSRSSGAASSWTTRSPPRVGVRAPYFKRELNQYCYTPDGGTGNSGTSQQRTAARCAPRACPTSRYANGNVGFQGNNPMGVQFIAPYSDEVKFDDILPNVGLSCNPTDSQQFYLSYAEGLSAPRTDNLYSVRRQPDGSIGRPLPESETTKAYDLGWRLNASEDHRLGGAVSHRLHQPHRVVVRPDRSASASTATSAT